MRSFHRVVARPDAALDALFEAVHLRTDGVGFVAEFALPDPRAALAVHLAPLILQNFATQDERRAAFDSLAFGNLKVGEFAQQQLSIYAPPVLATLKDVAKLCEAAVVRSTAEHERLGRHFAYLPAPLLELPSATRAFLPRIASDGPVVIWSPQTHARQLSLVAFALEDLRREVMIICSGGSIEGLKATFVPVEDAGDLLRTASVVVDAAIDAAGEAIALAQADYQVVCASTTGAIEYLDDVILYEPWDHRSIFSAVTIALGAVAPRVRVVNDVPLESRAVTTAGPLVTMVVRTYNRPQFLPRALESLARQTYENLEILVVNDGGADVREIVEAVPKTRYLALPENRGTAAAANAGLHAAAGTYIGFLDDDDIVFPEHIAVLVAALEECAGEIAHSDTIAAHFQKLESGEYETSGYVVFLDGLVEPTDFYVTDAVGPMAVLMKRSVVIAAGGYHEDITHAEDWELYLNLSQHFDFIHVPRITGVYSIRHDGSHMMSDAGPQIAQAMERLIERHPLPHRPIMETARRQSIEKYKQSGFKLRFPEPALKRP